MTVWLLVASMLLGFLSLWIVLPPVYPSLLPLTVGAPELSPWLLLGAVALCLLTFRAAVDVVGRVGLALSLMSLALCLYPLTRVPFALARFDAAMERGLGRDYESEIPADARRAFRPHAVSLVDFVRGISQADVKTQRGITFASPGGVALTLDVYRPLSKGPHPILLQLYGGAWQRGAPGDNASAASYFASRGYLVVAPDYRHAPASRWPAQLQDVRVTLGWIIAHADEFDGDRARIGLLGRSAGAQLALVAAYQAGTPLVRAVASYYGPVDLAEGWRHPPSPDPLDIRSIVETYMGGTPDQLAAVYDEASPVTYAGPRVPPSLLIYGSRDHIVEARFGRQLDDRLREEGARSVLLELPWAEHAFDALPNGLSGQIALYYTERFFAWALR